MTEMLMPYGSSRYAALVAKVGEKKPSMVADQLMPYGSAEHASLVAKVGTPKIATEVRTRKVVRLNARTR